jgi:hypothetical protein
MKPAASRRPALGFGDAAMAGGDLAVVETALSRGAMVGIEPARALGAAQEKQV